MKKPERFEIKEWLCENTVKGLVVHQRQTGVDTFETYWELIPCDGKTKILKRGTVEDLVILIPNWVRVLKVLDGVRSEVGEYKEFVKREAVDMAEYIRLKKKFGE